MVDLLKNPRLASGDQILAIPTLVRKLPRRSKKSSATSHKESAYSSGSIFGNCERLWTRKKKSLRSHDRSPHPNYCRSPAGGAFGFSREGGFQPSKEGPF